MKLSKREKEYMQYCIETLEKTDFLVPKLSEIEFNRFAVSIFKKLLKEEKGWSRDKKLK